MHSFAALHNDDVTIAVKLHAILGRCNPASQLLPVSIDAMAKGILLEHSGSRGRGR